MHALHVTETDFLFPAAGGAVGGIGRENVLELAPDKQVRPGAYIRRSSFTSRAAMSSFSLRRCFLSLSSTSSAVGSSSDSMR